MPTRSPLRQLADLISQAVDNIDTRFSKDKLEYPDINAPFNPTSAAEGLSMDPAVIGSAMLIVSACAQLSATVNIPALTLYDAVGAFHVSSALRVALAANVVEILRNNRQGLHVDAIAKQNGMERVRLGRILRLLATHHIFIETSPDTFSNNRLSSMMDTLKAVEDIQANPVEKHTGTPGVAALMEHSADECFKSSAFLTEVLLDKVSGHSDASEHTAFARAFHTKQRVFDWYEEPENSSRLKRFASAMEGAAKLDPPNTILKGFDWGSLAPNSIVVDVGGGLGHAVMQVHKQYPNLKCVVQDRPKVIEEARRFWQGEAPDALSNGSVELVAHNFYTPQKIEKPAVFLCKMILHDHGKGPAKTILDHLRVAASPDSKLIIIEQVVPYACLNGVTQANTEEIKGAQQMPAPPPLLSNLGKANAIAYLGDFQMFTTNGGEERTLGSFVDLLSESRWKIVEIFTIPGSIHKQILAVPV